MDELLDLRTSRKLARLTVIELSRRSGVSRWRLSMCETEGLKLRPDEIEALRRVLAPELVKAARFALDFQAGT